MPIIAVFTHTMCLNTVYINYIFINWQCLNTRTAEAYDTVVLAPAEGFGAPVE